LLLAHLIGQAGIECVVLESRPRAYAENRVRASVLQPATVASLIASGVGGRLGEQGLAHHGIELRFEGQRHRVPLSDLVAGGSITIYDQHALVHDLIRARLEAGGQLEFEAVVLGVDGLAAEQPVVHYRQMGYPRQLTCDIVVGCDGFWSPCRALIPPQASKIYRREYPFAWLGVLAAAPPPDAELVYAYHARGFAL